MISDYQVYGDSITEDGRNLLPRSHSALVFSTTVLTNLPQRPALHAGCMATLLAALFLWSANLRVAHAQAPSAAAPGFEELYVTARKRTERLDEAPMSLTAFTSDDFAKFNMSSLYDLGGSTPNLFIGNFGNGNQNHVSLFMRGVGTQDHIITVDSAVGLYLDGVYLGRQVGANLSLANIERIEVARGPQGVAYGRNAIGGAINVLTRRPGDETGLDVTLQTGSRGRAGADLYGSVVLTRWLAASATGFYNRRGGIGRFINQPETQRQVGETREAGGRVMLNVTPIDDFSLLLAADLSDGVAGESPTWFNAPPGQYPNGLSGELFAPRPDDNASPARDVVTQTSRAWGASATADWRYTRAYAMKLLGSYRYSEYAGGMDQQDSIGAVVFPERGDAAQFSLELQLDGDFDSWKFIAGAYYYEEDGETVSRPFRILAAGVIDGEINVSQRTRSRALFGSVDWMPTAALTLGGGMRLTRDSKDAAGVASLVQPALPTRRHARWTELTWDASVGYAWSDDLNLYLAVARGYQSGGFPARPFGGPAAFVQYDPQFALNYELGLKGVLAGPTRVALTLFHTDYTDLQLQTNRFDPDFGFLTITENAGAARARGVELEAHWQPHEYFALRAAVGYTAAEFTRVAPAVTGARVGGRPQLTPDWTVALAPELSWPLARGGALSARLNYSYRAAMFGEADNQPLNLIGGRELLGFNIRYQPAATGWRLTLYGENILNEVHDTASGTFGNPFAITVRNNNRSEFGIRLSYRTAANGQ